MISKIPILGDVVIPKEVGEGLFGISFKIKGPKGNTKTTINPIRTLTPRFIQKILDREKLNNFKYNVFFTKRYFQNIFNKISRINYFISSLTISLLILIPLLAIARLASLFEERILLFDKKFKRLIPPAISFIFTFISGRSRFETTSSKSFFSSFFCFWRIFTMKYASSLIS